MAFWSSSRGAYKAYNFHVNEHTFCSLCIFMLRLTPKLNVWNVVRTASTSCNEAQSSSSLANKHAHAHGSHKQRHTERERERSAGAHAQYFSPIAYTFIHISYSIFSIHFLHFTHMHAHRLVSLSLSFYRVVFVVVCVCLCMHTRYSNYIWMSRSLLSTLLTYLNLPQSFSHAFAYFASISASRSLALSHFLLLPMYVSFHSVLRSIQVYCSCVCQCAKKRTTHESNDEISKAAELSKQFCVRMLVRACVCASVPVYECCFLVHNNTHRVQWQFS